MRATAIVFGVVLLCGCARPTEEQAAPQPSGGPSIIDHLTGKAAVDAHKKAKTTIEEVSAKKKQDLDGILE